MLGIINVRQEHWVPDGSGQGFLQSPGNFSGTELYFKLKIYKMVV